MDNLDMEDAMMIGKSLFDEWYERWLVEWFERDIKRALRIMAANAPDGAFDDLDQETIDEISKSLGLTVMEV